MKISRADRQALIEIGSRMVELARSGVWYNTESDQYQELERVRDQLLKELQLKYPDQIRNKKSNKIAPLSGHKKKLWEKKGIHPNGYKVQGRVAA